MLVRHLYPTRFCADAGRPLRVALKTLTRYHFIAFWSNNLFENASQVALEFLNKAIPSALGPLFCGGPQAASLLETNFQTPRSKGVSNSKMGLGNR